MESEWEETESRNSEIECFQQEKISVKRMVYEPKYKDKIPSVYVQPPHRRPITKPLNNSSSVIPTISLAGIDGPNRHLILRQIGESSKTCGFFQIVDHGIPQERLDNMIQAATRFHDLLEHEKMQLHGDFANTGVFYEPSGLMRKQVAVQWNDNFLVRLDPSPPQGDLIPHFLSDVMKSYAKSVDEVGRALINGIAETLGVKVEEVMKSERGKTNMCMTMRCYPPCPRPDLTLGLEPHSDAGYVTLLLQDDVGGLEVFHDQEWHPISSVKGALIVNIGDTLEILSNGRFRSANHRVVTNSERCRISVGFFYTPSMSSKEDLISPLSSLVDEDNPPRYRSISFVDYLALFISHNVEGKSTLDHVKL